MGCPSSRYGLGKGGRVTLEVALAMESGDPVKSLVGCVTSLYLSFLCCKQRLVSPGLQSCSEGYVGCKEVSATLALTEGCFLPFTRLSPAAGEPPWGVQGGPPLSLARESVPAPVGF